MASFLVLVLGAGLGLRLLQSHQGLPYLYHWDEPQIASRALSMLKTGDFNPHFFNYGSFLIYLNLGVDIAHYLYLMKQDPESLHPPLDSLADLRIGLRSGWTWTVSHPSFYLWNRSLTAVLGTLCVLGAYLLGSAVAGRPEGLLAALALATTGFHIEQSAWATTDVPASCLALYAVWFSFEYLEKRQSRWLYLAAIAAGLATSTKYTAGLAILVPWLALLVAARERRLLPEAGLVLRLAILSPAAFLFGTPYSVLDLPRFVQDVGFELRHYAVAGHYGQDIEPGLGHLAVELREFWGNLGPLVAVLAVVGMAVLLRGTRGRLLLFLPLLHLAYISRMAVHFHRNQALVYPFAAIGFGVGAMWLIRRLRAGRSEDHRRIVEGLCAIALIVVATFRLTTELSSSLQRSRMRDSRSRIVDQIEARTAAGAVDPSTVVIEKELHIHAIDLERLSFVPEIRDLRRAACRQEGVIVVGGQHETRVDPELASELSELARFSRLHRPILAAVDTRRTVNLRRIFKDPQIYLLGPSREPSAYPFACREHLELAESALEDASIQKWGVSIRPGGQMTSPSIQVPAGYYQLSVSLLANYPIGEEDLHVRAEVLETAADQLLFATEISPAREEETLDLSFRAPESGPIALRLTSIPGEHTTNARREVVVKKIRLDTAEPPQSAPRPPRAKARGDRQRGEPADGKTVGSNSHS